MNIQTSATMFHQDGFVVARQLLSMAEVQEIEENTNEFVAAIVPKLSAGEIYYEDSPTRPVKAIHGMDRYSEFFHKLRNHKRIQEIVRSIWPQGEIIQESVAYFEKSARYGSVTPPHQDNFFQHWLPPMALTATIAIDQSTPENGALICAKGSHLQLFPHHPSDVMGFSMTLDDPVDTDRYPEIHLCLEPGDVAFHHVSVIHRSGANHTDCSRRQLAIGYRSSKARKDEVAMLRHQAILTEMHTKHRREVAIA